MAKTTLDQIQREVMSITEIKSVLIHQTVQMVTLGPKYQGKLLFIEGESGIGKTEIVAQAMNEACDVIKEKAKKDKAFAKIKSVAQFLSEQDSTPRLEVVNLSAREATDYSGMPIIDVEKRLQSFCQPDMIPTIGIGTILYDEANRINSPEMKSTLLSLWMDRSINGHKVGDGYLQVATGNNFDSNGKYDVENFDYALQKRVMIVRMKPTMEEVVDYLEKSYKGHFLFNYIQDNPAICNIYEGSKSDHAPRDLAKALDMMITLKEVTPENKKLVKTLLLCNFTVSETLQILKYTEQGVELSVEMIVENPSLVKKIKKSNLPLIDKLCVELFQRTRDQFLNNHSMTDNEKKAYALIGKAFPYEKLVNYIHLVSTSKEFTPSDMINYLSKECLELVHCLKPVEKY